MRRKRREKQKEGEKEREREREWEWQLWRGEGTTPAVKKKRKKRSVKEAITVARNGPRNDCPWKDLDTLYSRGSRPTDQFTLSHSSSFFLRRRRFLVSRESGIPFTTFYTVDTSPSDDDSSQRRARMQPELTNRLLHLLHLYLKDELFKNVHYVKSINFLSGNELDFRIQFNVVLLGRIVKKDLAFHCGYSRLHARLYFWALEKVSVSQASSLIVLAKFIYVAAATVVATSSSCISLYKVVGAATALLSTRTICLLWFRNSIYESRISPKYSNKRVLLFQKKKIMRYNGYVYTVHLVRDLHDRYLCLTYRINKNTLYRSRPKCGINIAKVLHHTHYSFVIIFY